MKTSIAIMPSLPSSAGAGIASQRARKLAFSLIEFDHGTGDRPSYGGPAKRDFGYLQSILLKDENHLCAPMCRLKKETQGSSYGRERLDHRVLQWRRTRSSRSLPPRDSRVGRWSIRSRP